MTEVIKRKTGLDAFTLKLIAIIGMTCNHIAHGFEDFLPLFVRAPLYILGGLTFPIMAYFIVQGYHKTSNLKKYMLRLLIFGLISLVPFVLVFKVSMLNILFTFLLGLICLYLHEKMKIRFLFWLCFILIVFVTLFCDWAIMGVPMILMYGTIKNPKTKLVLPPIMVLIVMSLMQLLTYVNPEAPNDNIVLDMIFTIVVFASIPLLSAYNGQRGYSPKSFRYLFYIYYPVHLIIIGGIAWLLMNIK